MATNPCFSSSQVLLTSFRCGEGDLVAGYAAVAVVDDHDGGHDVGVGPEILDVVPLCALRLAHEAAPFRSSRAGVRLLLDDHGVALVIRIVRLPEQNLEKKAKDQH